MKKLRLISMSLAMAVSLLLGLSAADAQAPKAPDTTSSGAAMSPAAGQHKMDGEVTKVNAKKGWVDVKTAEGSMKLHFPPSALQSVKKGDQVSVEIALAKTADAKAPRSSRTEMKDATKATSSK